jgi:DsbC/DsbD-like thiol-disulfide interchange protein
MVKLMDAQTYGVWCESMKQGGTGLRTTSSGIYARSRDGVAATIRVGLCLAAAIALGVFPVARAGAAVTPGGGGPTVVKQGNVQARISLSDDHAPGGHLIGVAVDFAIAPGWHIYGEPLPAGEGLTPTSIKFEGDLIARQQLDLPKPTPLRFKLLDETYPVYQGSFKATGNIVLRQNLKPGDYSIPGTFKFQECNDAICKMPQSVSFELPIKIVSPRPSQN